ncbi:MAG: OFA family MFS transporter [Candidatus Bathyarchaeia archaeon]
MHRWAFPIIGSIINLMLGGLYSFSLYYQALQATYDLKFITPLALAYSIAMLFDVLAVFVGGIIYDKKGPKLNVFLGATLMFFGYVIGWCLRTIPNWDTARWLYYIGLGVMQGLGTGLTYAATTPTVVKWFPDRPGLASGVVIFGFGIGATILTPLIQYFLNTVGIFQTFLHIGLIYFLVLVCMGIFIKNPPADYRLYTANLEQRATVQPHQPSLVELTLKEAIKTRGFYILWLAHAFSSFTGLMVIGNIAPIISESGTISRFNAAQVSTIVPLFMTITSIFNACGRPFWGQVSDRIGPWRTMQLNFLITAALLTTLSFAYINMWGSLMVIVWIYFCYGGQLALFSPATALYFRRKHFGRIYGLVCTAWGVAGLTGGTIGALIRDLTGSYFYSFYLAAALSLIATAIANIGARKCYTIMKKPSKK